MSEGDLVHMKRMNTSSGLTITIRVGVISLEVSKEKAEYICRMLAHFLNLEIVGKHQLKNFDADRNIEPNGKYLGNLLGIQEELDE